MLQHLTSPLKYLFQWIKNNPWKWNLVMIIAFALILLNSRIYISYHELIRGEWNVGEVFKFNGARTTTSTPTTKSLPSKYQLFKATTPTIPTASPGTTTPPRPTTPPRTTPPPRTTANTSTYSPTYKCDDFLLFANSFKDGRGLGNQIFNLAAGHLFAKMTKRRLALNNSILNNIGLEEVFDYHYERFNQSNCQFYTISDLHSLGYNPDVEKNSELFNLTANKTILTNGFFQSWKYTLDEKPLRNVYLNFKTDIKSSIENYFTSINPANWRASTFTRVGVHVRRGDVLTDSKVKFGYTTPKASYFINAMLYILSLYKRVQFIIVTNDKIWAEKEIQPKPFLSRNYTTQDNFNILISTFDSAAHDLAILAMCHHTIISTGTFGWSPVAMW
ncbi:hypothetical protein HELRODRAFT_188393 [Helobdella robusta]|uniref:L-Fucosyltransferase n=1 Tax=Helobdella robusta TaxID=6412 RepID=T1FPY0_HELRO|nr:hypothetical protein HELRODRAFT_188393 [Helobdella robusta]ESO06552.1 hypothetical protein HELRODRAFT_188393 [Helobdella robusta]